MTASPSSPGEGDECDDEPSGWEAAGRSMLEAELVEMGEECRDEFVRVAGRVHDGEELRETDVKALRDILDDAAFVVEFAAIACEETQPFPEWWEVLGDEALDEYGERIHEWIEFEDT